MWIIEKCNVIFKFLKLSAKGLFWFSFWFCLLLGVQDRVNHSSVVSLYFPGLWISYNWRSFFFASFSSPSFSHFHLIFFPNHLFLPFSTPTPYWTYARSYKLYGLVMDLLPFAVTISALSSLRTGLNLTVVW